MIRNNPMRPGGRQASAARAGFTLVEILIVVVILGILAAIVMPELSSASRQAREGVLKDDLRFMREQVTRYMIQHNDVAPGYPAGGNATVTPDESSFIDQMTRFTDVLGNSNVNGSNVFKFGPYLTKIPDNPLSTRNTILVIPNGSPFPAPDLSQPYGWMYKPETLQFMPNMPGTDLQGIPYMNY